MSKKTEKFFGMPLYGPTLAQHREKAGLTQEQLSHQLGITRVTLAGWERQVEVKITEDQAKTLKTLLKLEDLNVLTIVPHGTDQYILSLLPNERKNFPSVTFLFPNCIN